MHAFRCKNCGHLHDAEHAGLNSIPHSCCCCGAGVKFTESGLKRHERDNWEVLADCSPERLTELGLTPEECCKHTPDSTKVHSDNLVRIQAAHDQLCAKEKFWSENREKLIAEFKAKISELNELEAKDLNEVDYSEVAEIQNRKSQVKNEIDRIRCCEWTGRDQDHKIEVTKGLANNGSAPNRKPTSVFAGAMEGLSSGNKSEGNLS